MDPLPRIRIIDAHLGVDAQVRLVISGLVDPDGLQKAWASAGALLDRDGDRITATTTVRALVRAAGRTLGPDDAARLDAMLPAAVGAWTAPAPPWRHRRGAIDGPAVMGILNVTPDSFSDGGAVYPDDHPAAGVAAGRAMLDAGAAIIDVGGESTRPGAEPVAADEEIARVVPVVAELASDRRTPVSIDTSKVAVAEAALAAGAAVVNDVSGGRQPELLELCAHTGAGYVLMHTRGTPQDMAEHTSYADVVAEVFEWLAEGVERVKDAGVVPARIAIDPGIGFAKTASQSLALLGAVRQLTSLGHPVLIGASRKSFMGSVLEGRTTGDRLAASLAVAAGATLDGAAVIRAHDVAETSDAVRTAHAIAAQPR